MNEAAAAAADGRGSLPSTVSGWRELWLKEDWWAVWLGLGLTLLGSALFLNGSSLGWIAVTPAPWSTWSELGRNFAHSAPRYLAQFLMWSLLFAVALRALGYRVREFAASFTLLYLLAVAIFALGQWKEASHYNLEPPLVALLLGLALANLGALPRWLDAGFRVEFYIKVGIVLLGATLPFTLLVWAGPVAIVQASIVSLITFFTIYFVARRLGLEQRFAAILGAGGSVCGVSAAIAVSGAVGGRKQDTAVAIATVIIWAIAMIFLLPLAARYLQLPAGIAGAWIGTSEFADAAGLAAAQAYGNLAGHVPGITGTADQTLTAFTLMKVVGRDAWIGIWAFLLALAATTRWEARGGAARPDAAQIWWRFPKFVLGFLLASLLVTWVTSDYTLSDYNARVVPGLVAPLKGLRTWAFIFSFLSIGLSTRFRELARSGPRPFLAFAAGAAVNVVVGFILSVWVFAPHWRSLP
jgi:uncharacterized integral membrane protein (TIGR00698 family)